jgi:hypothetical protein
MHSIIIDEVTVPAMNSWQRCEEMNTQKYRYNDNLLPERNYCASHVWRAMNKINRILYDHTNHCQQHRLGCPEA